VYGVQLLDGFEEVDHVSFGGTMDCSTRPKKGHLDGLRHALEATVFSSSRVVMTWFAGAPGIYRMSP
jgi:hypothetical protein